MKDCLVIGSRGSKLALTQANMIKGELQLLNPSFDIRIEIIKTSGDVKTDPLSVIGGKGVFTKELEEALLAGHIDIAVHSLKDLPTILPDALSIAAIGKREDPRDALVLRQETSDSNVPISIDLLPIGATVGTSSPRRLAQLKYLRSDLIFEDLRGNVDTRLRKLDEGQYDALILACAGLHRLGLENRISVPLPIGQMLPAVGQGAIAIEARTNDKDTLEIVGALSDETTRLACTAERAFLRKLGGGCQLPIAGHAVVHDKQLSLDGLIADPEGKQIVRDRLSGSAADAEQLGTRLAERLLASGAADLLAQR